MRLSLNHKLYLVIAALTVLLAVLMSMSRSQKKQEAQREKEEQEMLVERTMEQLSGMKRTGKLTTVRYTFSKAAKAGGSKILFGWEIGSKSYLKPYTVYVEAGVDMTKYDTESVKIDPKEKTISLVLPKTEVFLINMTEDNTRQVNNSSSGFAFKFDAKETLSIDQKAEKQIKESIAKDPELLVLAKENATRYFTTVLTHLGYESVQIQFK